MASPVGLAAATPTAIRIPAIDVSAPVNTVGLNRDHTMQVPAPGPLYNQPAWYRYSPTPGQLGPSVIIGHIDSARDGPSVFFKLGALTPGEQIQVDRTDHTTATFEIDAVRSYPKKSFPTTVVYGPTSQSALRLITCGGSFNRATGQYRDNTVVFAHLTGDTPIPSR
jgi:sortase (surface protein transpeptidase)